MRNKFHVGAVGKRVQIQNIGREPELTAAEALELGAYLVATAIPLRGGDAVAELGGFLRLLEAAAEDSPLAEAVRAELEE
jgi:hypothetical protein